MAPAPTTVNDTMTPGERAAVGRRVLMKAAYATLARMPLKPGTCGTARDRDCYREGYRHALEDLIQFAADAEASAPGAPLYRYVVVSGRDQIPEIEAGPLPFAEVWRRTRRDWGALRGYECLSHGEMVKRWSGQVFAYPLPD